VQLCAGRRAGGTSSARRLSQMMYGRDKTHNDCAEGGGLRSPLPARDFHITDGH